MQFSSQGFQYKNGDIKQNIKLMKVEMENKLMENFPSFEIYIFQNKNFLPLPNLTKQLKFQRNTFN